VADAIRDVTGLPVDIKWPNDINLSGRKLAGILAEAATHGGEIEFVVLGIGVNLQPAAYPAALANRATSIAAETSKPADRALVLAEILAALGERYADLRAGRFDAILSAWRSLAPSLPGAQVEWDSPSGVIRGRAEGIDDRGALLARAGDTLERLVAGEVRFL
jgi:BirA family biotin operon repressor/biotin-[acetyl-CoA-carboxylase] ligase